ncbi:CGNR zinc finger domain-containing protein, partial [Streptomyces albidoflavus]|uniref:CGNR zinc finger domain-containing protein n=1 Tax=Streptomyces albidoflavus TaxID=1886 RepID=UPI000BAE032C
RAGPGWLAAFRDLRTQIAAVVGAELDGRPPGHALDRVNAVGPADGTLGRGLSGDPDCQALLGAVARDAVDLLTDPGARALLRRCAGQDCPLVYLDTSRGRRRRWCSGETCGNRERVARHRRSRRG